MSIQRRIMALEYDRLSASLFPLPLLSHINGFAPMGFPGLLVTPLLASECFGCTSRLGDRQIVNNHQPYDVTARQPLHGSPFLGQKFLELAVAKSGVVARDDTTRTKERC